MEHESRYDRHLVLGIDKYLEVVEVYAVTLLATALKDADLAISWVENASLPEENRQVNKGFSLQIMPLYKSRLMLFRNLNWKCDTELWCGFG